MLYEVITETAQNVRVDLVVFLVQVLRNVRQLFINHELLPAVGAELKARRLARHATDLVRAVSQTGVRFLLGTGGLFRHSDTLTVLHNLLQALHLLQLLSMLV